MNKKEKILSLSDFLTKNNLEVEAQELLSIFDKKAQVNTPDIESWYKVLEEIDSEYIDPAYSSLKRYLTTGSNHLNKAAAGLQGVSKEEVERIIQQVPLEQIIRLASKKENLVKYSSESGAIKFCEDNGFTKDAGLLGNIIPLASLVFGVVNFYYCSIEFSKLMSEVPEAGLQWYEPLMPKNLMQAAQTNKEAPDKLRTLGKATKTSEIFVEQFISLVSNTIDGIKDLIFIIANVATGFLSVAFDLGISLIIMLIESAVKGEALSIYKKVKSYIRDLSVEKIHKSEMKSFDNLWSGESDSYMEQDQDSAEELKES